MGILNIALAGIALLFFCQGLLFFLLPNQTFLARLRKLLYMKQPEVSSPMNAVFMLKFRLRGVSYIVLSLYLIGVLVAPRVLDYIPWPVLLIPFILSILLTPVGLFLSARHNKATSNHS